MSSARSIPVSGVIVREPDDQNFTYPVPREHFTVLDLKRSIFERRNIPVKGQTLLYGGHRLEGRLCAGPNIWD